MDSTDSWLPSFGQEGFVSEYVFGCLQQIQEKEITYVMGASLIASTIYP